jgi:phosphatidylglycerophosphatase C
MVHIAVFDLDKTLTDRDCFVRFLLYLRSRGHSLDVGAALRRFGLSRTSVKRSLCALLRGSDREAIEALAHDFFEQRAKGWLRPNIVDSLNEHKAHGDRVIIVSASLSSYVSCFASFLETEFLATELESDGSVLTGRIHGENVRGNEKVMKLETFLSRVGYERSEVFVTAYGDSAGDREMLTWADQAVKV